jgi:hypothetical protein
LSASISPAVDAVGLDWTIEGERVGEQAAVSVTGF